MKHSDFLFDPTAKTHDLDQQHRLRLRRIAIDTYHENVAYLHRDCSIYRAEGFQALSKIQITMDGQKIVASLNVVDDERIVGCDELGLAEQAFAQLGLKENDLVAVQHADPPRSMDAVRRKLAGERLVDADFMAITTDITANRYSKIEMAAFLLACGQTGLERDEVLALTKAMVASGETLSWDEPLVVDKHCIGGIPGNRTSMLVVPIVAAHGLLMPKTSSRAITSPAGTADTMEVLANVELNPEHMRQLVKKERGCLVWGGTARLAPVDDLLIAVERPLEIDSVGQMVASILSKKVAAGSTHLLIDIPVGKTAKIRQRDQALRLRKIFEYVGDQLGLHIDVVITDGSQPVGRGIGPVLEARDVMAVLRNDPQAPLDLKEKTIMLAGRIIEFDPVVRGGTGQALAREILESGRALAKMQSIIESQGRTLKEAALGSLVHDVKAPHTGIIQGIDNFQLAKIARRAGAPMDKGAGVDLLKKNDDHVRKGEVLYRIYAQFPSDFHFAQELSQTNTGYDILREIRA